MGTGVSRLAIGVTFVGALAAVLYYLGHSQALPPIGPQVSALFSLDLLRLIVYLALFVALALVILRQHAVERRLPRYDASCRDTCKIGHRNDLSRPPLNTL